MEQLFENKNDISAYFWELSSSSSSSYSSFLFCLTTKKSFLGGTIGYKVPYVY